MFCVKVEKRVLSCFFIISCSYFTESLQLSAYESYGEALKNNNFNDGNYLINIHGTVRDFNVFCKNINNDVFETQVGTNQEDNITITGYEDDFSYNKTINYSTLNDEEMNKFLLSHSDCEQFMFIDVNKSRSSSSKFVFWDGAIFDVENVTDGICKCIVNQVCQDQQHQTNLVCLNRVPTNQNNPMITHYGKLSVNKKRLPLKQVFIGDTGVKKSFTYNVGKLVCRRSYLLVQTTLSCIDNKLFTDDQISTCYNFKKTNIFIKIFTLNPKFRVLGKNSKCLNIKIYSMNDKKLSEKCSTTDNCLFNCKFSSIGQYNLYFENNTEENIELCEILNE